MVIISPLIRLVKCSLSPPLPAVLDHSECNIRLIGGNNIAT
jgi:hypothetical protein